MPALEVQLYLRGCHSYNLICSVDRSPYLNAICEMPPFRIIDPMQALLGVQGGNQNHNLYFTPSYHRACEQLISNIHSANLQHSCWEQEELTLTQQIHPNPPCKCPLLQHSRKMGGYNPEFVCSFTAHCTPALSDRFLGSFSSCQCPSVGSCLYTQTRRHKRDHLIIFLCFLWNIPAGSCVIGSCLLS